jgi:hypothetical protein
MDKNGQPLTINHRFRPKAKYVPDVELNRIFCRHLIINVEMIF